MITIFHNVKYVKKIIIFLTTNANSTAMNIIHKTNNHINQIVWAKYKFKL